MITVKILWIGVVRKLPESENNQTVGKAFSPSRSSVSSKTVQARRRAGRESRRTRRSSCFRLPAANQKFSLKPSELKITDSYLKIVENILQASAHLPKSAVYYVEDSCISTHELIETVNRVCCVETTHTKERL